MLTKVENGKRVLMDSFSDTIKLISDDVISKYPNPADFIFAKFVNRILYQFFYEINLPITQTNKKAKSGHLEISLNSEEPAISKTIISHEVVLKNTITTYTIKFTIKLKPNLTYDDSEFNIKTEHLIHDTIMTSKDIDNLPVSTFFELVLDGIRQVWAY